MENKTNETGDVVEIADMDDEVIAKSISDSLKLEFSRSILVKEMPIKKLEKVIQKSVPTGEMGEDDMEITELVEETVEVDSVIREGIIIKLPAAITELSPEDRKRAQLEYAVGDRIMYRNMRSTDFDYLPGSALVEPFDVICKATK